MDIDRLIANYLHATFGAIEAYHKDPLFHTQVKWLRDVCHQLDKILSSESIDDDTRFRIINSLLSHTVEDPLLAQERVAKLHATLAELKLKAKPVMPRLAD